jgi:hypothetical protein
MITNEQLITGFRLMQAFIIINYDYLTQSVNGLCNIPPSLYMYDLIDCKLMDNLVNYISTHRPTPDLDSEFYLDVRKESLYYFHRYDWDTRLAWVRKQIKNLQK